jgi:hypothetical protein
MASKGLLNTSFIKRTGLIFTYIINFKKQLNEKQDYVIRYADVCRNTNYPGSAGSGWSAQDP